MKRWELSKFNEVCHDITSTQVESTQVLQFLGNLERAISLFEKALKLAKSEMELTHIFSLKDAAQAQLNVTNKMGLSLQSLMANMPGF